jgi:hypothetical protein
VPQVPVSVYKAIHDQTSSIEGTNAFLHGYSMYGANVCYQRNTKGDNFSELVNGKPSAMKFLEDVLSGEYEHEGCIVEDVSVDLISTFE